jgi:hypothetical protein
MKHFVGIAVFSLSAATFSVRADTFTFQPSSGEWNEPTNWLDEEFQEGTPGPDDTAIIPAGKQCHTDGDDCSVGTLNLESTAFSRSELKVQEGTTFYIYDAAVIGGDVYFTANGNQGTPVVHIKDNVTIQSGPDQQWGQLAGGSSGGYVKGIVTGDSGKTLTVADGTGAASFLLTGNIDVEVPMVNDSLVVASGSGNTLTLKTNAKSGDGLWKATNGGKLKVEIAVSGAGDWVVDEADARTEIRADCTSLTGDVSVTAGTFWANFTFCTDGALSWTGGNLVVDSNDDSTQTATFAGCCTCP